MAGKKRGKYITSTGGMTHVEIGQALGLSSQRVQQIEAAAFQKIRLNFPELFAHVWGPNDNTANQDLYHGGV